jgi:hypothetical protein
MSERGRRGAAVLSCMRAKRPKVCATAALQVGSLAAAPSAGGGGGGVRRRARHGRVLSFLSSKAATGRSASRALSQERVKALLFRS